ERSIVQERMRAGLRRARDEGKTLGRRRLDPELEARIRAALKEPGRTDQPPFSRCVKRAARPLDGGIAVWCGTRSRPHPLAWIIFLRQPGLLVPLRCPAAWVSGPQHARPPAVFLRR